MTEELKLTERARARIHLSENDEVVAKEVLVSYEDRDQLEAAVFPLVRAQVWNIRRDMARTAEKELKQSVDPTKAKGGSGTETYQKTTTEALDALLHKNYFTIGDGRVKPYSEVTVDDLLIKADWHRKHAKSHLEDARLYEGLAELCGELGVERLGELEGTDYESEMKRILREIEEED